jgi:hypothetical protein
MVEELKRIRQEALKRGEFISLTNGDCVVPLPLVVPGRRRGWRVYLGDRELYYRKGNRFYSLGYLQDVGRMNLAPSPLRKKGEKLPRSVENLFRFLRTASPDLNPLIWEHALSYLEELKAAVGVGGEPERIYCVLNEGGWKDSYPLPDDYFWDGARLKEPWTSLRSLTGGSWDVKEGLKRLAEEALEKGEAWVKPPSLKYDVKIGLRLVPEANAFETSVSAEYRGLMNGHYGMLVNWKGAVFLGESD